MPTTFDDKWKFIAEQCIERIEKNKTASITSVISFLQSQGKLKSDKPTLEDLLIIEGYVISDKKYKSDRINDEFHVTLSHKNWIERHPTSERIFLLFIGGIITISVNLLFSTKEKPTQHQENNKPANKEKPVIGSPSNIQIDSEHVQGN